MLSVEKRMVQFVKRLVLACLKHGQYRPVYTGCIQGAREGVGGGHVSYSKEMLQLSTAKKKLMVPNHCCVSFSLLSSCSMLQGYGGG